MTIQSRMNKRVQRLHRQGLAPSEWAANLSNKPQKKKISKIQNPIDPN
jgi:hypothetical protein